MLFIYQSWVTCLSYLGALAPKSEFLCPANLFGNTTWELKCHFQWDTLGFISLFSLNPLTKNSLPWRTILCWTTAVCRGWEQNWGKWQLAGRALHCPSCQWETSCVEWKDSHHLKACDGMKESEYLFKKTLYSCICWVESLSCIDFLAKYDGNFFFRYNEVERRNLCQLCHSSLLHSLK